MSRLILLFSLFLAPAFADRGSQKSAQNLCSNNVSHKRQKRDWIWNQMHIKEEIDTPFPHHVGKITSSVRNNNAKYIIEGEYANTIFKVEETSGDVYAFERLDREKKAEYELTALIIDRTNNRSLERPSKFIIKVHDINDNAPVFVQKVFNGSVPEMSPVGMSSLPHLPSWLGLKFILNMQLENPFLGTSVTKVTAVDADDPTVSGHATVTYQVTTGGEYFTIDDSG
ncbi:CADH5 protein, partial [Oreocharis arfaki]|nr:CADH5 protein [Oreocharis arfaki]